jgi:catechol 2,3-dioxygenase-like lactoylglutathione lyase family enzyme
MKSIPPINGVVETALYVRDLDASLAFYQRLFGFEVMLREERIISLRVREGQVLLLFKLDASGEGSQVPGGFIPGHDASGRIHMGIGIAVDQLEAWIARLNELGVKIESRVTGMLGGTSIYFRDPDDHLIELLTPGIWPNY